MFFCNQNFTSVSESLYILSSNLVAKRVKYSSLESSLLQCCNTKRLICILITFYCNTFIKYRSYIFVTHACLFKPFLQSPIEKTPNLILKKKMGGRTVIKTMTYLHSAECHTFWWCYNFLNNLKRFFMERDEHLWLFI